MTQFFCEYFFEPSETIPFHNFEAFDIIVTDKIFVPSQSHDKTLTFRSKYFHVVFLLAHLSLFHKCTLRGGPSLNKDELMNFVSVSVIKSSTKNIKLLRLVLINGGCFYSKGQMKVKLAPFIVVVIVFVHCVVSFFVYGESPEHVELIIASESC